MRSILIAIFLYLFKINLHVQGRLNAPLNKVPMTVQRQAQQRDEQEKKFLMKEALKVIEKDGKDPELLKLTGMSKLDLWITGILDNAKNINKHAEKLGAENVPTP
jgi:hypothetical protein